MEQARTGDRGDRLGRIALGLAVAALVAQPAFAQTIIDNFSAAGANTVLPPGVVRASVGSSTGTDSGLSGVIGGVRALTVTATVIAGGSPEVRAGVIPGSQVMDYASTVLADGLVTLRYDANGAGLGANLSPGDGIQFDLVTDASAVPCAVTVTLSDGVTTVSSTQTVLFSGITPLQFLYTSFAGVDLTSVFSIEVTIDPSIAGDLEAITPIITFGEPFCGNGEVELVEQCDDGNAFAGDGCEPDCTLSTACTYSHPGPSTERFVGLCGLPTFLTIQAAVSASGAGDIVTVCPGTYNESVVVDREVTIRSFGGAAVTTVQSPAIAFDVRRSGVRIEGLTIEGATAGIQADAICGLGMATCTAPGRGSNLAIVDNIVRNGALGVGWQRKIDCASITGNTMTGNAAHIDINQLENAPAIFVDVQNDTLTGGGGSGWGVRLQNLGAHLTIAQNTVQNSAQAGVVLANLVSGTQLLENNIRNNATDGVTIQPGAAGVRVIENNIEGNGVGLGNQAPEGVVDATLNWWGSQTGPFHVTDRPSAVGDEIQERLGGLDTTFIEFLCSPAPAGFPSVAGECDTGGGGQEIEFITFGRSPDISPNGRFISFVSDRDLNGDARITVDNSDLSDEVFVLNRKPVHRPVSFCVGGLNPGAVCTKQSDCRGDLAQDPIVTDGACVLITQLSHDPSGANQAFTPRVTQHGDVFSTETADLIGVNGDLSREVVRWVARDFRRQNPPNPNTVIDAVSSGPPGVDTEQPAASRNGRYVMVESLADFTGHNADGNRELFVFDNLKQVWQQITETAAPIDNRRPSTHNGRQVLFDSTADLHNDPFAPPASNADGNREIFLGEQRGTQWFFTQITNTTAPVDNRAGQVARKGKVLAFSSNGNFTGNNADGNREVFVWDRGAFQQITNSTAGENVAAHANPRGRFVTFESTANLEGGGNTVLNRRVFLFDRKLNVLTIVSRSFFGDNFVPRLSNGRFIVWESTANLTGQNPTADRVIYAFDRRRDS